MAKCIICGNQSDISGKICSNCFDYALEQRGNGVVYNFGKINKKYGVYALDSNTNFKKVSKTGKDIKL